MRGDSTGHGSMLIVFLWAASAAIVACSSLKSTKLYGFANELPNVQVHSKDSTLPAGLSLSSFALLAASGFSIYPREDDVSTSEYPPHGEYIPSADELSTSSSITHITSASVLSQPSKSVASNDAFLFFNPTETNDLTARISSTSKDAAPYASGDSTPTSRNNPSLAAEFILFSPNNAISERARSSTTGVSASNLNNYDKSNMKVDMTKVKNGTEFNFTKNVPSPTIEDTALSINEHSSSAQTSDKPCITQHETELSTTVYSSTTPTLSVIKNKISSIISTIIYKVLTTLSATHKSNKSSLITRDKRQSSSPPPGPVEYYDFFITEASFKFWTALELFTCAVLLYSTFAAIYYARYVFLNPNIDPDKDYADDVDVFTRRRRRARNAARLLAALHNPPQPKVKEHD